MPACFQQQLDERLRRQFRRDEVRLILSSVKVHHLLPVDVQHASSRHVQWDKEFLCVRRTRNLSTATC